MTTISVGGKVPDFSIRDDRRGLPARAQRGSNVVIYFYPRDNTPGCTLEGSDFRDLHRHSGAQARQSSASRPTRSSRTTGSGTSCAFRSTSASDEDHALAARFGVWKQKNMYGRKMMGIERSTFLIDAEGVLRQEWRKVRVAGHAEQVLAAVRAL